jgi:hypothetical protein
MEIGEYYIKYILLIKYYQFDFSYIPFPVHINSGNQSTSTDERELTDIKPN